MLRLGWMAILLFALPACSTGGEKKKLTTEDRSRLQVEVARGALLENDPTTALRFLLDAEKKNPEDPEVHYLKALSYYAKNLYPEAETSVRLAVELNPSYSDAWNTLGRILLDRGKLAESETALKKAAYDPIYLDAFRAKTNLGILYYRQGRFSEAKKAFDDSIQGDEERSCVAYYYRGNLAIREDRKADALRDYRLASRPRVCGGFAEAQLAMGALHAKMKNYADAKQTFLEVRKTYPDTKYADQAMEKLKELP